MLKEVDSVKQIPGEPFRRWFSSEKLDLIVWYGPDKTGIIGFQLCYPFNEEEKALVWHKDKGFLHQKVDSGEDKLYQYKLTPILLPDGVFDKDGLLSWFEAESREIDQDIGFFVRDKVNQYRG